MGRKGAPADRSGGRPEKQVIRGLGPRLQRIANEHGGHRAIARLTGPAPESVGRYCRGDTEPPLWWLRRMAHLGGVSMDYLVCDIGDEAEELAWAQVRKVADDYVQARARVLLPARETRGETEC